MLQKILMVAVVILIIAWIIGDPAGAGTTVHGWFTGIFTFFKHVTS